MVPIPRVNNEVRHIDRNRRNSYLASSMARIISEESHEPRLALDVGAGEGEVARRVAELSNVRFFGIEPRARNESAVRSGVLIRRACAVDIPFDSDTSDVAMMISVYEHILPDRRHKSLMEIKRVLRPGAYS